ncbi:hypothetical protein DAPPUDRAFT_253892 [Daphnia pulex]|uniref:Uncharacterized protein n=1 Tax=Daphnia pulex TaxID=6669 RepID=E9H5W3_DAPPU|nr:hypothetical protein DAPPUDRAFT_253892 [Daphnia pulex]|eukprot:EFX72869.1 hypothetical protein DAPPUDRAFT_253892 [Daphnia pulex]
MTTATTPVPVTSAAVTNPSTVTLLLTRPPSIFTTTKRPNRPLRPVRPGRPTRPTRPTIRPTTPNGTNPPGVFTMSPILGSFTRPPFQPVTRPTPLPPKPKPTSLKPTTTTGKPFPAPASVGNGECTNYIPVSSQNTMSGMTAWCNNNCRLGYCPSDFCKCSE